MNSYVCDFFPCITDLQNILVRCQTYKLPLFIVFTLVGYRIFDKNQVMNTFVLLRQVCLDEIFKIVHRKILKAIVKNYCQNMVHCRVIF